MRLRERIELTEPQKEKLDANLQRLKGELQELAQDLSFLSVRSGRYDWSGCLILTWG